MMKILLVIFLVLTLAIPASALEITPPAVPENGLAQMPEHTDSFGTALMELMQNGADLMPRELEQALQVSWDMVAAVLLFSLLMTVTGQADGVISIAAVVTISTVLFRPAEAMMEYASEAVLDICAYGKLLCPVMTTALAAQGGITASAALYTGTTVFITCLSMLVSRVFVPMVYLYMILSISHSALGEECMKKFADVVKNTLSWLLKTMLLVFTTYMSVTGVVSGTTDAAALKAAKVTISSVVPVVGGILSDASESVLVSIGVMKNAAGIYGIVAVLAVFVGPFVKVGIQYLLLKGTAALCSLFGNKSITALIDSFSTAMGLLLAMVGSGCLLVLISTVCFMKGCG